MPGRFKIVASASDELPAVHAMVVHPVLVYYRIDERLRVVRVLRIVHGSQKQPTQFD